MDRELDEALRTYSARTPPAGMEERILRRTMAQRRRYWMLPVAAGLLIGIVVWPQREPEIRPQPAAPVVRANRADPMIPAAPTRIEKARRVRRRPSQFPAPVPLTREERALLTLFERTPGIAWPVDGPVRPLEIAEIEIAPLSDCN